MPNLKKQQKRELRIRSALMVAPGFSRPNGNMYCRLAISSEVSAVIVNVLSPSEPIVSSLWMLVFDLYFNFTTDQNLLGLLFKMVPRD